ncbi:hypothetical protein COOONC_02353 [Cooperia oncophora]
MIAVKANPFGSLKGLRSEENGVNQGIALENGCSIRAGECNGFSVVSEVVVKEEPASRREEVVENQSEDGFLQQQDRNADFVFFGGNNLPSTQASTVDMIYACGNPGWEMWTASVSM